MAAAADGDIPAPPGLTGFAILYAIVGALALLAGFVMLATGSMVSFLALFVPGPASGLLGLVTVAVALAVAGLGAILAAVGMGSGERWGWLSATGLAGVFTAAMVWNIVRAPTSEQALGVAVPTFLGVLLLVYWFHDRVRAYFGW